MSTLPPKLPPTPKPVPVPVVKATPALPAAPKPTPEVRLYSTSHLQSAKVSILYQGTYGTGKTYAMMSWPQPFFLYFDANLAGLAKFPNIPYAVVSSWDEVERFWLPAIKMRRLTELVRAFKAEDGSQPYADYKVETLCLDSLTSFLGQNFMDLGDSGAKSLGYDGWDQYYGRIHRLVLTATKASRPYGPDPKKESYHVLASIHESDVTNDAGDLIKVVPSVQGKMRSELGNHFDAILLTNRVTRDRVVTAPGKPPEKVEEASYYVTALNQKLRTGKDQISGGRYGMLPSRCDGTYATLNQHWQLDKSAPSAPDSAAPEGGTQSTTNEGTAK